MRTGSGMSSHPESKLEVSVTIWSPNGTIFVGQEVVIFASQPDWNFCAIFFAFLGGLRDLTVQIRLRLMTQIL